jgi:hypothetical protein
MSVSFYLYIGNNNSGWNFPEACKNRMNEDIVPHFNTPEECSKWINSSDVEIEHNPNYDPRLNINMSTRNARFVLNELGIIGPNDNVDDGDVMTVETFEAGVRATLARNPKPIPGLQGYTDAEVGRLTIIGMGVADGYANKRMEQMLKLVEAAREYGATHIGWG